MPPPPDLGRSEHATGAAHVTEGSLTSTVSTTTRDTRDTGNSTTCVSIRQQLRPQCRFPAMEYLVHLSTPTRNVGLTYRYPRTRPRSGDQPSRSQRTAGACSWPYQCGRSCKTISDSPSVVQFGGNVVDILDDIRTDLGGENGGQGVSLGRDITLRGDDADRGALGRHGAGG
jgi:hypothetical protein